MYIPQSRTPDHPVRPFTTLIQLDRHTSLVYRSLHASLHHVTALEQRRMSGKAELVNGSAPHSSGHYTIRPAVPDDATAIRAIYAPYVVDTCSTFETDVPTLAEMQQRLDSTLETYPWMVCSAADHVLGYAYAGTFNKRAAYAWSVETSIYIDAAQHGRGIGRALYTTLLEVLRVQGFVTACAAITMPNPGSVGLHTALGFRAVGTFAGAGFKHGRWHDVSWWALALNPHATPATLPTAFAHLAPTTIQARIEGGVALAQRPT